MGSKGPTITAIELLSSDRKLRVERIGAINKGKAPLCDNYATARTGDGLDCQLAPRQTVSGDKDLRVQNDDMLIDSDASTIIASSPLPCGSVDGVARDTSLAIVDDLPVDDGTEIAWLPDNRGSPIPFPPVDWASRADDGESVVLDEHAMPERHAVAPVAEPTNGTDPITVERPKSSVKRKSRNASGGSRSESVSENKRLTLSEDYIGGALANVNAHLDRMDVLRNSCGNLKGGIRG